MSGSARASIAALGALLFVACSDSPVAPAAPISPPSLPAQAGLLTPVLLPLGEVGFAYMKKYGASTHRR